MIKCLVAVVAFTSWLSSPAQTFRPVEGESSVKFRIKNFGLNVNGSFSGLRGTIKISPDNLPASTMDVTLQASTVKTGIDMRDNHLRKPEYFYVKKYPVLRFVSVKITPSPRSGTLFMFGKLTIKNVTREISFPFTMVSQHDDYLFTGEFRVNRLDYGVGESSAVGDNVTIVLKVLARKG